MQFPKTAIALVLVGAVGLASAAYGIGSATGGGSATADPDAPTVKRDFHVGPPPVFDDLADALGVDADKLEEAMEDFHSQERGDHRDDLSSQLAKALGRSADDVAEAFDEIMEGHRVRFDERLAKELGVEVDELREALERVSEQRPDRRTGFTEALAEELDIDPSKIGEAFEALRPRPGARLDGPHRGAPLRKLAEALDVSRAQLRKALREVRAGTESGWEQHEDKLAAFLADRFGLDVGEVEKALADLPRPKFRVGPRGPGGPELHGPGPGGPDGPGFGLAIG
jgi:hypothetical protein